MELLPEWEHMRPTFSTAEKAHDNVLCRQLIAMASRAEFRSVRSTSSAAKVGIRAHSPRRGSKGAVSYVD
jgi:hypothetical protein